MSSHRGSTLISKTIADSELEVSLLACRSFPVGRTVARAAASIPDVEAGPHQRRPTQRIWPANAAS